jgi:hypothetical protein
LAEVGPAVDRAAAAAADYYWYVTEAGEASKEASVSVEEVADAADRAAEAAAAYYPYIDSVNTSTWEWDEANRTLNDSMTTLDGILGEAKDALGEFGVSLDEESALMRDMAIAAGETTTQNEAFKDAIWNLSGAVADGIISNSEYIETLLALQGAAEDGIVSLGELRDAMGNLPREVRTAIYIDYVISQTGKPPVQGGTVIPELEGIETPVGGPFAAGGPVFAQAAAAGAAAYWVGEVGPELFIPSQDGRILSNSDSMALAGGAAGIPTFHNIDDLYDESKSTNELLKAIQKTPTDVSWANWGGVELSELFKSMLGVEEVPTPLASIVQLFQDKIDVDQSVANMSPALGPKPEETGNYWEDFANYWLWNAGTPPPMEDIEAMFEEYGNMLFTPTQGQFIGHRAAMQELQQHFETMHEYGFNWDDSSNCWKYTPAFDMSEGEAWSHNWMQFAYERAYRNTDVPYFESFNYQSIRDAFAAEEFPDYYNIIDTPSGANDMTAYYSAPTGSAPTVVNVTINAGVNMADKSFVERELTPYIERAIREAAR